MGISQKVRRAARQGPAPGIHYHRIGEPPEPAPATVFVHNIDNIFTI